MSQTSAADTSSEDREPDDSQPAERSNGQLPDADDMSQEELDEIEEERKRRLDPENRPDSAEVDNTDREFDADHGEFTDADHDEQLGPFEDPM